MKRNLKQQEYPEKEWNSKEMMFACCKSVGIVLCLSYFFYRSWLACLPLAVIGIFYFQLQRKKARIRCKEELLLQFKECILSVSTSLKAGYAIENAFMESRADMELLYGKDSMIYQELEKIRRGLVINITLEEQLFGLAQRSGGEEIGQFANVFSIAKRSAGNFPEIIKNSSELIGQRLDAKQEMKTRLSGRQMEQNLMRMIPFIVLGYIGFTYPGYFDMLYDNWQGRAIMTGCLAIYLIAYGVGEKIMQGIEEEIA